MKKCKKCNENKDESEFHKHTASKDGLQATCKKCRNITAANYRDGKREESAQYAKQYRGERKSILDSLKNSPCMDCKNTFPPYVMDFDHRDPKSKFGNVSRMLATGCSLEQVMAEVSKCDLVCANCHRIRTHDRGYAATRTKSP